MPRFLHTAIFVNDMDASIDFYTRQLGLALLRGPERYEGNCDMAWVGTSWDAYLELVFDLEEHAAYDVGNVVEHLALEVEGDIAGRLARLRAQGVEVLSERKKSPDGDRWIAFVRDPNGITVELLEPPGSARAS